jgi:chorismate synthase
MHKNPSNLREVRENLSEAAYAAWTDKSFVPRAVVMVNAMGKIVTTAALALKAAELSKQACTDPMLNAPPVEALEG